jgi:WD40 repeat protein/ABC-type branched-subunit amino acid transport system substrate-binding protein
LASGSTDKTIKLWDVKTGKEIKPLKGHDHWVNSVSFSSDGQTLASGSEDNTVKIWDVKTGKEITPKPMRHDGSVYSVSFSSDGQTLASGSTDKTIKLWDVKTGKEIKPLKGHDHWVYSVSFSPDGQTLASGSGDSTIKLWYLEAGEEIYTLKGYGDKVYSVSFSSDGQTLASGSEDNTIKIWDVKTGKEITPKPMRHDGSVYSVSFSPDGQTLASGSEDNTIKIWDVKTGKEITPKLMRHDGSVYSVSFSSDGQTLASGSNDKTIKIWDVKTGKEITPKPMRHDDFVNSVSFSRNGQILASGSSDNTIKIWDVKTGEEISPKSIQGNSGRVYSVSFSYDGQTLASGGEDNTIKIWDVKTRKEIRTLKGHDDFVNSVSFSPNGQTLASVSNDNTIKLWNLDLNLDSLIERSCDWVRVYLANPSSDLSESDRQLCDGISEPEKHGEISISEPEKHEKISIGDKILVPTLMNPDKLAGVEAISNGDFEGAIKHLEAYLKNTPNDPEALIYLNNARIGNQKSYTIAISAPIGSDVNGALEMLRGVAQAQDENNQQRGINGVPLRVLIADDDDKPDTAKQIAEQLVKNPDVLGVIGHYASDVTLAAGKVYEAGKLVAISPVSTSVKLTNFGNYIFRTVPSDSIAAKALADYILLRLEKKNAAVFYNSQSGYSESLKSEFMKFLRKEGGQVSKFDLSDPNFNADESVKQSIESGAEVLVLLPNTGELNDTLQVLKANKKRLPLLGGDDVYAPKVLKEGAKNSVGMVVAVPWHILAKASQTNFPDTSRQLWKADVNWRTAMSYDATMALIEGLKNNPTREGLAQTLHSQNFTAKSAATGEVKFKSGDRDREIQLVEIQANPKSRSKYGYDFQPVPNKPDK